MIPTKSNDMQSVEKRTHTVQDYQQGYPRRAKAWARGKNEALAEARGKGMMTICRYYKEDDYEGQDERPY